MEVINFKEVSALIEQGGITKNIYVADPNVFLSKKGSIVFKPIDKTVIEELKKSNLLFLKI